MTVSDHAARHLLTWASLSSHTLTRILSILHTVSFVKSSTGVVWSIACEIRVETLAFSQRMVAPARLKSRCSPSGGLLAVGFLNVRSGVPSRTLQGQLETSIFAPFDLAMVGNVAELLDDAGAAASSREADEHDTG